jgi:hypothetical protein
MAANAGNLAWSAAKAWLGGDSVDPPSQAQRVNVIIGELNQTREQYLESSPDTGALLEKRRAEILGRLTKCQTRILFEIADVDLLAKVGPFSIEQMTLAYKASAEVQFSEIEFGISQMESLLSRNQDAKITRRSRRSTAVVVTTVALIALVVVLGVGYHSGWTAETAVPILQIPVPVLIWSFIGSLGAMLYRFNTFADAEMGDPLRWSFTRPLTGILMGIIAYMAFKAGVLLLSPSHPEATTGAAAKLATTDSQQQLLWLASFLAGFSDRFADSVLRSLTGRLGGDKQADLVTLDATAGRPAVGSFMDFFKSRAEVSVNPQLPVASGGGAASEVPPKAPPQPKKTPAAAKGTTILRAVPDSDGAVPETVTTAPHPDEAATGPSRNSASLSD